MRINMRLVPLVLHRLSRTPNSFPPMFIIWYNGLRVSRLDGGGYVQKKLADNARQSLQELQALPKLRPLKGAVPNVWRCEGAWRVDV